MLEIWILGLFAVGLTLCVALGWNLLYALLFGLVLFLTYGLIRKHSFLSLLKMSLSGILTTKNVLLVLFMIGALTAVWRAAGTIPFIIYYATRIISPETMLLFSFLLCAAVSLLMGTSFGTAATMGVICMTMGGAMGISPLWMGGAILCGCFFGDRCSPMSTSALLVAELTDTDLFDNIKTMLRTALLPFIITCAAYLAVGFLSAPSAVSTDAAAIFADCFELSWVTALPAVLILVMAACRVNVRWTVLVNILCAGAVCLFVQKMTPAELLTTLLTGFAPENTELAALMSGGGIVSMLQSLAVVMLSACYAGLFVGTGLLNGVQRLVVSMCRRIGRYGGMVAVSVGSNMVACNQTLGIMLTHQLTLDMYGSNKKLASDMEDTTVVIAPLIPWSIAGSVPLSVIGAPTACLLCALFLYLLPLAGLIREGFHSRKASAKNTPDK